MGVNGSVPYLDWWLEMVTQLPTFLKTQKTTHLKGTNFTIYR